MKRTYRYAEINDRCVTACCELNEERDTLKVSYAFCSHKDQFNRRIGRDIAGGRMDSGEYVQLRIPLEDIVLSRGLVERPSTGLFAWITERTWESAYVDYTESYPNRIPKWAR